jgi:hypothetical protein
MYTIEIKDDSRSNTHIIETISPPVYVIETNSSSVKSVNGKSGEVKIEKIDVGLSNVNNTSDADKPASNAVLSALEALDQKILLVSQLLYNDDIDFDVPLPMGFDQLRIAYPQELSKMPSSIYCYIKNNDDNVIYENRVSEITLQDFLIEFSDFLSSDSYVLNVRVSF